MCLYVNVDKVLAVSYVLTVLVFWCILITDLYFAVFYDHVLIIQCKLTIWAGSLINSSSGGPGY